jgi:hypothetical protein
LGEVLLLLLVLPPPVLLLLLRGWSGTGDGSELLDAVFFASPPWPSGAAFSPAPEGALLLAWADRMTKSESTSRVDRNAAGSAAFSFSRLRLGEEEDGWRGIGETVGKEFSDGRWA